MSLRFHEIAERDHRILNPFTDDQLGLLGRLCRLEPGQRHLDLCSGKGEMLCTWSAAYGTIGIGVDISEVFLEAARRRAVELAVEDKVTFVRANASTYEVAPGAFDIVSCIGATWIGAGLAGTLELMRPGLAGPDSLLLVGEPYWIGDPPPEAYEAITPGASAMFASLPATISGFEEARFELVEMVLADHHGWDRYVAPQWRAVSDWLRDHDDAPDADEIRRLHEQYRREYFAYTRPYLGWGVFVLRQLSV